MTEREEATMKPFTANDPEAQSADILAGNIEQLKTLFPEAFSEGKIDFEVLRQLLGGAVEEREEKYGLNWHGKRKARQLALTPSTGTLRPCPEESVEWESTKNLMIEGDNLEVLKLLQKSYANKVKLIYIDPPYNTGKDFVYPDNFQDNIKNYLELTGQVESGRKISSNTEASGRFHTDWLNMMYPRLKLARNLLRDDGVIFISCDDNEVSNLRKLCDEIFGEENFVAELIWERAYSPKNDAKYVSNSHDYILVYVKVIDSFKIGRLQRTEEANARYQNPDNDPRGVWKSSDMSVKTYNSACDYPITTPSGRTVEPPAARCWSLSKNAFFERLQDNRIWFGADGNSVPSIKRFLSELKYEGMAPTSILFYKDVGHSQEGAQEVVKLFEGKGHFDGPKPKRLLRWLFTLANTNKDSIILDFFAGSGTTGHAVLDLNKHDNGNRKFLLVQLPEPCASDSEAFKAGYKSIAEITKERLRRAASKIKDENPLFPGDLGFRVFKLDSSNINTWEPDRDNLELALTSSIDHLKDDRSEADILYELLLKLGLDLCVPIEKRTFAGKEVHSVGGGVLLVCLATHITRDEVEPLAQGIVAWYKELAPAGDTTSVFRDSAFADDVAKTNLAAILQQHGLEIIRSL